MKEHDELTGPPPPGLGAREERIARRLTLVGQGPAAFFRDACRIMSGADGLEAQTHLVAHCTREIESALRAVLRAVVDAAEADAQKRHRAEIVAILTALGFAPEDPVSIAWLDIVDREQYGLHRLAHRDSLRAPRRADKEFEKFWDGMLSVLDAVTGKVEERFLHWLPKIDALAAKDRPTQRDAQFVLTQVPSNNVTLGHFFDQISSPAWIEPLHREGSFQHPPAAVREGDYIRFPSWPESRYLARVAGSAPSEILLIAKALPETDNVRVFEDFVEAALQMPAELAAQMVPMAKEWAASPHHLVLPDLLGKLMSHLARGGQVGPALDLATAALEVLPDPRRLHPEGDEIDAIIAAAPEPRGRFSEWDYRRVLEHIPVLVEADAFGTLDVLIGLLDAAVEFSDRDPDRGKPDLSYIWRPAIEEHDQNMPHGIKDPLVEAVRDAAVAVSSRDEGSLRRVVGSLEAQSFSVFRRIALHILRTAPEVPIDLLAQRITDPELMDDSSVHHEFWLLARDRINDLQAGERSRFFALVEAGPDRAGLKEGLERWNEEPVTDEDVKRFVENWKLRRLMIMEDALPLHLAKTLDDLRQDGAGIEHPEFLSYMGELKTGPSSPVDDAYLRALPLDDLVRFLKDWRPGDEWMGPSREGLGSLLQTLVSSDPKRFAAAAERFKDVDPTYVRGVVSGLEAAHKEHKTFPWEPVLNLCRWVVEQPREIPEREDEYSDLDPGWVWTRRAIASLLRLGFGARADEIPIAFREAAWKVLRPITDDAHPTPEDEDRYGGDNMDPHMLSINSTRGEAMHTLVRYGLWVHRHLKANDDRAIPSFEEMPEVREVLDAHLDPDRDSSLAIRSVYGQWLPWLIMMDRAWTEQNLTRIFPVDGALAEYRDAAWDTYIWRCGANDASFDVLGDEYLKAADRIASRKRRDRARTDPDKNLAEHVMTYYWQGKLLLDDGENLLGRFYSRASADLWASALEFVGRSIRSAGAEVLDRILERIMRLWEWRLDEAASLEPEARRKELGAFGWWFAAEAFPEDWAIAQLERALTEGGGVDADHLVAERIRTLSERYPREAMVCMRLMAAGDDEGWGIIGWRDEARSAITAAMASGNAGARAAAESFVNYLGTRGHLEFRDLLPNPRT